MALSYDVTPAHRGGPQANSLRVSTFAPQDWTLYRFGRYTISARRLVWVWDYHQMKARV